MFNIKTNKDYTIYAQVLEEGAIKQFQEAMDVPSVVKGALMADAHKGFTLPIGGVVATKDYIFPSYVGVDIGCGMCATKLDIEAKDIDLEKLFNDIYINVPVGHAQHATKQDVPEATSDLVKKGLEKKGFYQLGTLGGGNHFIEIGEGRDGKLWIVIHSGSRNLGHQIAKFYMKKAAELSIDTSVLEKEFTDRNEPFKENAPEKFEIAKAAFVSKKVLKAMKGKNLEGHHSFHVDSDIGKAYISDMNYCLEYALSNRKAMIDNVVSLMGNPERLDFINRNHNHADLKDGLWIHRKGATHAGKGIMGVIPGNMRDGCFIVKGKGCKDSLESSSHGAGRVLSRKKASATLDVDEFKDTMTKASIIAKVDINTLDESPDVYKNIFDVIDAQKDLIEVIDHIRPLVNIKG